MNTTTKLITGIVALTLVLWLLSFLNEDKKQVKETLTEGTRSEVISDDSREEVLPEIIDENDLDSATTSNSINILDSLAGNERQESAEIVKVAPVPTKIKTSTNKTPSKTVVSNTRTAGNAGGSISVKPVQTPQQITEIDGADVTYTDKGGITIDLDLSNSRDRARIKFVDTSIDPVVVLSQISGQTPSEILNSTTFTYEMLSNENKKKMADIVSVDTLVTEGHTWVTIATPNEPYFFWLDTKNTIHAADAVATYLRKNKGLFWEEFFLN